MERGILRLSCLVAGAFALLAFAAGCGSGSDTASVTDSTGASSASNGSAQFVVTKENKAIVRFGKESSSAEREAAGTVLEGNLKARQAADFGTQCASLSAKVVKELAAIGQKEEHPATYCATELKKLAEPLSGSKEVRKDTLDAPIAALRVKGDTGYALYHGNDGKDYSMLMEREGGQWKVGALLTEDISAKPESGGKAGNGKKSGSGGNPLEKQTG